MKLSASMTQAEFDNGYWYATELKTFAKALGLQSAGALRKDQLEKTIVRFIRTGRVERGAVIPLRAAAVRDVRRGLRLSLPVVIYTNDHQTKSFLEAQARKIQPAYRRRSGARYRLNRWRDAQLARGRKITYRDLVKEYVRLSRPDTTYARVPTGRYINFLSDFLASEEGATMARAIQAWKQVKAMDQPKTYAEWARQVRSAKRRGRRG